MHRVIPALCVVIGATLSGCTPVTTYGLKPKEITSGNYIFTLFDNADATQEMIDAKVSEVVEKIRIDNNYRSCDYSSDGMAPEWRNKEIDVNVRCKR